MSNDYNFENYCVSFIDLLGQRAAMEGEGIITGFQSQEEERAFVERAKSSVGAIIGLQKNAKIFLDQPPPGSINVNELSEQEKGEYDEMKRITMSQQRWSDGLVFFSSLKGKAPMNAIWEIFGATGCLCLLGLAGKKPLRGGIEISWGIELHSGELYGPAIANSYKLESEIAQYPRIVVGQLTHGYLESAAASTPQDKVEMFNKNLAVLCLNMLSLDIDGNYILDYLGQTFTESYTKQCHHELFAMAYTFASEQLEAHARQRNTKLSLRYSWLLSYLEAKQRLHA